MTIETITLRSSTILGSNRPSPRNDGFISKMFNFEEDKWVPADWKTSLDITLKSIIEGKIRFMVEFYINGDRFFLVTHDEDEQALRKKHPKKAVANILRIYKFLCRAQTDQAWNELLPKVLVCLNEFDGAKLKE